MLAFGGQPLSDQLLAELGAHRAAWTDPTRGTVIGVAGFERPAADPRPALCGGEEACGYYPVEVGL